MGKWAERVRQIEQRKPRANSANSADSSPIGTNDTIGTPSPTASPLGQTGIHDQPPKPLEPGFGGFGGDPTRPISETQARATLRHWHGHLSKLDEYKPPEGFTPMRWAQLVEDSRFIYEGYASQLVRECWSALDVFGVLPWRPNGGVLLERLRGARNLKLDGEGRAFWSSFGVTFQTCRGASEDLVSSGLVLLWELPQCL